MVNIQKSRMRSIAEARQGFSALVADAEQGLRTHVVKGGKVVAHIFPADPPVLDDRLLLRSMVAALAAREAAGSVPEWRDGRLYHAGDAMGRLLAWTWGIDSHLCMQALAAYHRKLQEAVGQTIDLDALRTGLRAALTVSLDDGQIAELERHIHRVYPAEYQPAPHRE